MRSPQLNVTDLKDIEKIDIGKVKDRNWEKTLQFAQQRVEDIQQVVETFLSSEEKFLENEVDFIAEFTEFIGKFGEFLEQVTVEQTEVQRKLQQELKDLEPSEKKHLDQISDEEAKLKELRERLEKNKQIVLTETKKKKELGGRVDVKDLSSIKITDNRYAYNAAFKWCLGCLYGEQPTKYDYKNFKKACFAKDQGEDFINRLKGFNFLTMSHDDISLTKKTMEQKDECLKQAEEKKGTNQGLRNLFDFIEMVNKVCTASIQIQEDEKERIKWELQRDHEAAESQHALNQIEAVKERIEIIQKYQQAHIDFKNMIKRILEFLENRKIVQKRYKEALDDNDVESLKTLIKVVEEVKADDVHAEIKEIKREEEFGGSSNVDGNKPNRGVRGGLTELDETPFAKKEKGGCECVTF